jgi:transcriptional regulator with XRE-family HTH domain
MKLNIPKVRREMKLLKMSQADLAKELGLTRQAVWKYFKYGATSFRVVDRLAKVLGLDPKDLII